jgi:hypothetical protein
MRLAVQLDRISPEATALAVVPPTAYRGSDIHSERRAPAERAYDDRREMILDRDFEGL